MSLFLQAMRQPRQSGQAEAPSARLAELHPSDNARPGEMELALSPEVDPREPDEADIALADTVEVVAIPDLDSPADSQDCESQDPPFHGAARKSSQLAAAQPASEPARVDRDSQGDEAQLLEGSQRSLTIIEPALLLAAVLSAIGLMAGVYLLLSDTADFGRQQSEQLQREMDSVQLQLSELHALEAAVNGEVANAGAAAVNGEVANAGATDSPSGSPASDPVPQQAAAAEAPSIAAPPADAVENDQPVIEPDSTPEQVVDTVVEDARRGALAAELAELKAQLAEQNSRIDQLSVENSRLQELVSAPPAAVEKATAGNAQGNNSVTVEPVERTPVVRREPEVTISELSAPLVRVDGTQSGAGARSVDDQSIDAGDRFRLLLRQGYAAFQRGDYARADSLYAQALSLEPYNRDANLAVASVAQMLDDYRRAEHRYRHLLSLDGQDSAAFSGLLDVAAALEDDSIEYEMVTHIGTIEHPGRMYAALGNFYNIKRSWQLARDAWRDALAHDVSNPDYAFNLAVSLDNLQRHNSAIGYYEQALEHAGSRTFHFDQSATRNRLEILIASRDR